MLELFPFLFLTVKISIRNNNGWTMVSKKIERFYLKSFLKSIGWDNSLIEETESPDFIIKSGDQSFGVEVTQLFKDDSKFGSMLKRDESEHNLFLTELAKEYYQNGGCPIYLSVKKIANLPDQNTRQELLLKLKSLFIQPWEHTEVCVESGNFNLDITRLPDAVGPYNRWICIDDGIDWVRSLDKNIVEQKIKEKSAKIGEYHKVIKDIVLLIVIDRYKKSGKLQWNAQETCHNYGFTSVYLHTLPLETHKIA
jgi:hypothetical protein